MEGGSPPWTGGGFGSILCRRKLSLWVGRLVGEFGGLNGKIGNANIFANDSSRWSTETENNIPFHL